MGLGSRLSLFQLPPPLHDWRFDVSTSVLWDGLSADLTHEQHMCAFKKSLKAHVLKLAFYN